MSFDEQADYSISLNDAAKMTKRFRDKAAPGAIIACAFGKSGLETILNQDDCVGIRFYFAEKEDGKLTLVLTGIKASGNDIYDGELAEHGGGCPPDCSSFNPLNS